MPINLCDECDLQEFAIRMNTSQGEVFEIFKEVYKYLCPFMIFICIFSAFYNIILICLSREKRKRNKKTVLLLSLRLAATDSIVAILNGLATALESYIPAVFGNKEKPLRLPDSLSKILSLIRYTAIAASCYHLLVLGLEHYRAVSEPFQARSQILCSNRLTRTVNIISIFCWAFPFTIVSIWFFILGPCRGLDDPWNQDFTFGFKFRFTILCLFAFPLVIMIILYVRIYFIVRRHQRGDSIKAIAGFGLTEASTVVAVNVTDLRARNAASRCPKCSARDEVEDDNDLFITILDEETSDDSEAETCDPGETARREQKSGCPKRPAAIDEHEPLNGNNYHQRKCIITLEECSEEQEDAAEEQSTQDNDKTNLYRGCDKDSNGDVAERQSLEMHKIEGSGRAEQVGSSPGTSSLEQQAIKTEVTKIKDTSISPLKPAESHGGANGLELIPRVGVALTNGQINGPAVCRREDEKQSQPEDCPTKGFGGSDPNPVVHPISQLRPNAPPSSIQRSNHMSLDRQSARMHKQRSNPQAVSNGISSTSTSTLECTCDNRFNSKSNKPTFNRLLRSNTIGAGGKGNEAKRMLALMPRSTMVTRFKGNQRSSISSLIARQFSLKKNYLHRTSTIGSGTQGSTRSRAAPYQPNTNELHPTNDISSNKMTKNVANRPMSTKAVWTTSYILLTYIICYLPVLIAQALTCVDSDYCPYPIQCVGMKQRIIMGSLTHLGLIIKSLVDPFIYYKRVGEVKLAINRYILKRRTRSSFVATSSMNASQRTHLRSGYHDINKTNSNSSFGTSLHRHRSLHTPNPRILSSTSGSCKRMPPRANSNMILQHQIKSS